MRLYIISYDKQAKVSATGLVVKKRERSISYVGFAVCVGIENVTFLSYSITHMIVISTFNNMYNMGSTISAVTFPGK